MKIFPKLGWERTHNETIEMFWDCEGYEQKERQPMGDYGYKIKEGHLYKFITAKGIYFVENGKATLVHSFNERKERSRQVTDFLIKNNYIDEK